ncbi:MAG: DNA-binding protein WhiA [Lachnospiraceae bacterium]|nr:DNA-binding protein WhiA [Lachnospiraceae bacterium]
MSFSQEVKRELAECVGSARHCRLAEMQAIWLLQEGETADGLLSLRRTPAAADRKFFTILKKAFNINADYEEAVIRGDAGDLKDVRAAIGEPFQGRSCCRRAFLRGAFLCAGTINDPSKSYHLEIVCRNGSLADMVTEVMRREELKVGQTVRNGRYVVYLKDGEDIVRLLGYMEAGRALLKMENERVVRDVRGNVNRRVNLEIANIGKAVDAAARQIEAIEFLKAQNRLEELPDSLREMAVLRIAHPEATLEKLGRQMHPAVGKSGVNHRLRRIVKLAEELHGRG